MIKKLPEETFKEIYRQVPRLCVEVVIDTPYGIILTKRLVPACAGMRHIPEGTVYHGEKLEDAVSRIAGDELGVSMNTKSIIGIIEYPSLYEKKSSHAVGIAFLCEVKPEIQKFRGGFQAEEIDALKIIPGNTVPEQKTFLEKLDAKTMQFVTQSNLKRIGLIEENSFKVVH